MLKLPLSLLLLTALEFLSVWFLAALLPLVVLARWPDSPLAVSLQRCARHLSDAVGQFPAVVAILCVVAIALLLRPKTI